MQGRPGGPGGPGRGPGGPMGPHGMFGQKQRAKNFGGTLRRLFRYLAAYKLYALMIVALVLAVSLLNLAGPYYIGRVVDALSFTGGHVAADMSVVSESLFVLSICYALSIVLSYAQTRASQVISLRTVRDMRTDLFRHLQIMSIKDLEDRGHGEWMSRMSNDIDNVYNTLSQGLTQFLSSIFTLVGAIVMMLLLSPLMTAISIITIPLSILSGRGIVGVTRKYFSAQQKALGRLNSYIEEMVIGRETVKAFGYEERSIREFDNSVDALRGIAARAQVISGVMGPLMNLINQLSFVIVAASGGYLALNGMLSVGSIASFIQYSRQFGRPINEIANLYNQLQSAVAGAERVFEALDMPPEPDTGRESLNTAQPLDVSFRDISFSYIPGAPVLTGFSLEVPAGRKVAIVGATGAGKTTIINLLSRFWEADGGDILIGNKNIRDIPKYELRSLMAVVLQDTNLFTGSVADNILRGRPGATMDEVRAAARLADAESFIERLPEGYDTMLSQSGQTLSKGQRQLLSIARAALKNPEILILDEATSNVDTRTEMRIQQAMIRLMSGRTCFVIAHRLSTIRDADVILVIDKGRVAESGSHEALLGRQGYYYDLYQSQFEKKVS